MSVTLHYNAAIPHTPVSAEQAARLVAWDQQLAHARQGVGCLETHDGRQCCLGVLVRWKAKQLDAYAVECDGAQEDGGAVWFSIGGERTVLRPSNASIAAWFGAHDCLKGFVSYLVELNDVWSDGRFSAVRAFLAYVIEHGIPDVLPLVEGLP